MKSDIGNYQTAEGLNDEQMSALLTDRLGRSVSVQGYKIVKGRRDAPREWMEALGIAPNEPGETPADDPASPGGSAPPAASSPRAAGVLPFEPRSAHMQITLIYTGAGKGAAMAMQAPPVADIWAKYAPEIATAYIEWAKESATVAHYISMLTLGGPAGNLISLHAGMIVTSLIVANKVKADALIPPGFRTPEETDTVGEMPTQEELDDEQTPPRPSRAKR